MGRADRIWWMLVPVLLAVPYIHLGVSFPSGWVIFTYGAEQLGTKMEWHRLWPALPLFVGVAAYEWVVRGLALRKIARRVGRISAVIVVAAIGGLLAAGEFWQSRFDSMFFWTALLVVYLRELSLGCLILLSGSIGPGVALHFASRFLQIFVIGDILSPYTPSVNYSSSSVEFYILQSASAAVPPLALAIICHLRRDRLAC